MPYKPVDTAIKIIVGPCIDDTDFKTREEAIAYNQAGMEIDVVLEKYDGTIVTTAVTPTTSGDYDWAHTDQGYYELEIPASGGADYNNTEEGILTVVGYCTGVLPFKSVSYDIVASAVYDSMVKGTDKLQVDAVEISGDSTAADNLEAATDGTGYGFTNCTIPTVTTLTGHTAQTGDSFARLGAPTGASISADLVTIVTDTGELQGDLTDGGRLDLLIDAIKAKTDNLPSGIKKNVALSKFPIYMVLSSDHVTGATSKTITGTISKDGSAFASLTNSITEISNGAYRVDLTQTEMNADVIILKFTETDCDQRVIPIVTDT